MGVEASHMAHKMHQKASVQNTFENNNINYFSNILCEQSMPLPKQELGPVKISDF